MTEEKPKREIAPLADRIPPSGTTDADEILGLFLDWVADTGLTLYPAQEEALLEIMAGKHVILGTPTGSGKSLVALGLHFKAACEGRVSYYTSPIKALASEKFFSLCDDFGAANVGMLTGDASINPQAKILCCTSEVLANMALRSGEGEPFLVMERIRGVILRKDLPEGQSLCEYCTAKCCRYFALPMETPTASNEAWPVSRPAITSASLAAMRANRSDRDARLHTARGTHAGGRIQSSATCPAIWTRNPSVEKRVIGPMQVVEAERAPASSREVGPAAVMVPKPVTMASRSLIAWSIHRLRPACSR